MASGLSKNYKVFTLPAVRIDEGLFNKLNSLPKGSVSSFIRDAVLEKLMTKAIIELKIHLQPDLNLSQEGLEDLAKQISESILESDGSADRAYIRNITTMVRRDG